MEHIDCEDFYSKMLLLEKQQLEVEVFDNYVILTLGNMEFNIKKDKARQLYNMLGEKLYQVRPEEVDGFFDLFEVI